MRLTTREIVLFGMLGSLMYASKVIMEAAPNIPAWSLTIAFTVVYRKSIVSDSYFRFAERFIQRICSMVDSISVFMDRTLGIAMLLPKNMPKIIKPVVYMTVNACHGFIRNHVRSCTGGLIRTQLRQNGCMDYWGLPFDFIHGISNFFCGLLIVPIISVLNKTEHIKNK